jgi:diadenosine tetraphosphate (Ap4A) HIT family hydrolase
MTRGNYPTIVHERIDWARQGRNPTVVCRLRSGWVVLGDDQRLPGYSLLLADPVRDSLNDLSGADRQQFLLDMSCVGDALLEVLQPSLINYSILGNTDRALHAHIHPRYDSEEPDQRRTHAIIYHWLKMPPVPFDLERDAPLMARLRKALQSRADVIE